MGHRIAKRVPLDFGWPLHEVWQGYLMPTELSADNCAACDGKGVTAARSWVTQMAALCLLLDDDRRQQEMDRPMHPYFSDTGSRAYGRPSADIAEFGEGLAGRSAGLLGHDALDTFQAADALIKAAALDPEVWGICQTCQGEGSIERYPGQREESERWEPTEPPEGEGWQLWETVSEGSPVSPVFASAEDLATWCEPNATWFASNRWPREQWLRSFLEDTTDIDSLPVLRERR